MDQLQEAIEPVQYPAHLKYLYAWSSVPPRGSSLIEYDPRLIAQRPSGLLDQLQGRLLISEKHLEAWIPLRSLRENPIHALTGSRRDSVVWLSAPAPGVALLFAFRQVMNQQPAAASAVPHQNHCIHKPPSQDAFFVGRQLNHNAAGRINDDAVVGCSEQPASVFHGPPGY